jgi:CTP synthase
MWWIEYCRDVLGWKGANTTEIEPECQPPVVIDMPEISTTQMGGTMRLGQRTTVFVKDDCMARTWPEVSVRGDVVDNICCR